MKSILFLDIDGVLNHHNWYRSLKAKGLLERNPSWAGDLDPDCVARLNRICDQADCEIVVSSTWRLMKKRVQLVELLCGAGLRDHHRLIDITPQLRPNQLSIPSEGNNVERGFEIALWLEKRGRASNPFAIVDDDPDMWEVKDRLVQTVSEEGGLTDAIADRVIEMLARPLSNPVPSVKALLLPEPKKFDWER